MLCITFDAESEPIVAEVDIPDDLAHVRTGRILLWEGDEMQTQIGTFTVKVFDVRAMATERIAPLDVFDLDGSDYFFYDALYKRNGYEFKTSVRRIVKFGENEPNPNLLTLDRIEIDSAHRGLGYGLNALRAIIRRSRNGIGLIAMKPFPLQFPVLPTDKSPSDTETLNFNERRSVAKLRRYFDKLGFERLPRTDYLVRSARLPLPAIEHREQSGQPSFDVSYRSLNVGEKIDLPN